MGSTFRCVDMCWGLNSHYFHIIGDKLINPIIGVYIPSIRSLDRTYSPFFHTMTICVIHNTVVVPCKDSRFSGTCLDLYGNTQNGPHQILGGRFKYFSFLSLSLGKGSKFDKQIFQMG